MTRDRSDVPAPPTPRPQRTKTSEAWRDLMPAQLGSAGENYVAALLSFAGNPTHRAERNTPGIDLFVKRRIDASAETISVKTRTYKRGEWFTYSSRDAFNWLALVLMVPESQYPRVFVVPRAFADEHAQRDSETAKTAHLRYIRFDKLDSVFASFENNFALAWG